MTYKKLLRQSRPRQDNGAVPIIHFPLVSNSPAMQALMERCVHMAKMGHFLFVLGHPGDLIEAQSLFEGLKPRLKLDCSVIASPGNERSAILDAEKEDVDSLFVPCATQIPQGMQEFMADGHLNHIRLVLLCYPMHKNMNIQDLVRPSLLRKSICTLQYPAWAERKEDHADCILAAADIAEKTFDCKLGFDEQNLHGFDEKEWKSLTHMLKAMMEKAKEICKPKESTGSIVIKV